MFKKLSIVMTFVLTYSLAEGQTKGTNTLGLGININSYESNAGNNQSVKNTQSVYSLGYGNFIKDNQRIGLNLAYHHNVHEGFDTQGTVTGRGYAVNLNYQRYYPLLKKFYAFAGGYGGTNYFKTTNNLRQNGYYLGANGGVSYFLSKRLALEADLLSAAISYTEQRPTDDNVTYESSVKTFNLSTSGSFNNLGFKIYFLF